MLGSILRSAQKVLSRRGRGGGEGGELSEPGGCWLWWGRRRLRGAALLICKKSFCHWTVRGRPAGLLLPRTRKGSNLAAGHPLALQRTRLRVPAVPALPASPLLPQRVAASRHARRPCRPWWRRRARAPPTTQMAARSGPAEHGGAWLPTLRQKSRWPRWAAPRARRAPDGQARGTRSCATSGQVASTHPVSIVFYRAACIFVALPTCLDRVCHRHFITTSGYNLVHQGRPLRTVRRGIL